MNYNSFQQGCGPPFGSPVGHSQFSPNFVPRTQFQAQGFPLDISSFLPTNCVPVVAPYPVQMSPLPPVALEVHHPSAEGSQ